MQIKFKFFKFNYWHFISLKKKVLIDGHYVKKSPRQNLYQSNIRIFHHVRSKFNLNKNFFKIKNMTILNEVKYLLKLGSRQY